MSDSKTYNFKAQIQDMREITAGRGTFATGRVLREGKRPVQIKIVDSALSKAKSAGLDLSGPVDLFGRYESKPFTNADGVEKTAQVFVVLAVSAVKSREEVAALVAAKKAAVAA